MPSWKKKLYIWFDEWLTQTEESSCTAKSVLRGHIWDEEKMVF